MFVVVKTTKQAGRLKRLILIPRIPEVGINNSVKQLNSGWRARWRERGREKRLEKVIGYGKEAEGLCNVEVLTKVKGWKAIVMPFHRCCRHPTFLVWFASFADEIWKGAKWSNSSVRSNPIMSVIDVRAKTLLSANTTIVSDTEIPN